MSSDASLVSHFADAESQLLAAAQTGAPASNWVNFEKSFAALSTRTLLALKLNSLADTDKRAINASVRRIQAITKLYHHLESLTRDHQVTLLAQTREILLHPNHTHNVPSKKVLDVPTSSLPLDPSKLDYSPCVEWFVTHFSFPYPSSKDKASLAAHVGVEPLSVERWFTNYRRRSGWSQVMKTFAGNNKNQMRALVEMALDPLRSHQTPRDARDAVVRAKSYLSQRTEISPGVLEALAQMRPMTPDELENYQKSRRARQQKVASLVKAAREKASTKNPVSAGKRKRHDENVNADDVRPSKRSHLAAPYPASSTPSPTYSSSTKRQREPSDDVSGEPASKKARSTRDDFRVVYDADGRAHCQRRKIKSRSTPMPKPTSPSSISTLSPTNPDSASKLQKRKSQPSLDTDESFSPSPPPAHKRRKLTPSGVTRSTSLNESAMLANSKQKKSSKDKKSRAGSAPVTSPPTAFPGPNDDVATEVRAVTNLQAPSTTIIHPPLTAKELDDILSGASIVSRPTKLPIPINTSLSNMSISQLQDLVPAPSNTHFPVQFYPLIPSADQISSSNAQVSLDLSSIGSFELPDNLDFSSLQGTNILTNQIMSQAPSSMLTAGDVTQFVQNEDLSSFMVPPMLHTTYSSPQPSLSSSPSSSPTSSFCSSPTSSTPSSTSLVKHPFLPTAQPPVVVAADRKELIRRKLELLETQRKALQMEMELEELESASAAGSQSVSRDFQSSVDLLSVM